MTQEPHQDSHDPVLLPVPPLTLAPLGTLRPRRSPSPGLSHPVPSQSGSPALTPSTPPISHTQSQSSASTRGSHRSHQEYLDSLQPPSKEEFARLAKVQEEREKEHRHRDHELQRQRRISARQSMEARRDIAQTKASGEERHRHSLLGHRHSASQSSARSKYSSKGVGNTSANETESTDYSDVIRSRAATIIQRSFRGYRARREMQGLGLNASTRWTHAIRDAQWREMTRPRARAETLSSPRSRSGSVADNGRPSTSRSAARQNWIKVTTIARRAGADEDSWHSRASSQSESGEEFDLLTPEQKKKRLKEKEERRKHAMVLGLQYFLEMIDLKHRYGSNLRAYHEEWKSSDTNENFFYWLDYGEGKNLDLAVCPREQLDRERVRYLSREERQYYLVKVDPEGRLVWAKNGARIDTTEAWKDSIHGIVPADDPTPAFAPEIETHVQSDPSPVAHPGTLDRPGPGSNSGSSRRSRQEAAMATKYANPGFDEAKGIKKIRHVSTAIIFDKLLRKSVRKNTWIFVADTSFRLYVGIKSSGAFQHSSFLHGARISAAGLIKIKDGRLASLSPLSGHYRPPASNFRAFVHSLEEAGVDMGRVSISKSYAVLVGLEAYVKTKRKGREIVERLSRRKARVLDPAAAAREEEALRDKSESAAREREVLEGQRRREELARAENKASARFMRRLGIRAGTPEGRKIHDDPGHAAEHGPGGT